MSNLKTILATVKANSGPIARIIARYLAGAGLVGGATTGELVPVIAGIIGVLTEVAYVAAKRSGRPT